MQYIENPIKPKAKPPFVSELERQAEKAMQHIEKCRRNGIVPSKSPNAWRFEREIYRTWDGKNFDRAAA